MNSPDNGGSIASVQPAEPEHATAQYVFTIEFGLGTTSAGLWTDPDRFETTLYRAADEPGTGEWLFFRDHLWRGEVADERHFRSVLDDALDVTVEAASFSELRTEETHFDAFKGAIRADLNLFNADSVDEVLNKYLGSSIRIVESSE